MAWTSPSLTQPPTRGQPKCIRCGATPANVHYPLGPETTSLCGICADVVGVHEKRVPDDPRQARFA